MIKKIVKNVNHFLNKLAKIKNKVLNIVSDILPQNFLRKEGFVFSNTMYKTAKRKISEM